MSAATATTKRRDEIGVRRHVAAGLAPLVVVVLATVALSAPVALVWLRVRGLRTDAETAARVAAELVQQQVQGSPELWRYEALKLVDHVRALRAELGLACVEVTDARGEPLGLLSPAERERLAVSRWAVLWASAPVRLGGTRVGEVWVALDRGSVYRDALLLLLAFAAIAAVLAALAYRIPLSAAGRAEARIGALVAALDRSRDELVRANRELEQRVAERSAALARACQELEEKELGLRQLAGRVVAEQEAERRAIARELHDSVGQALTAIRLGLRLLAAGPGAAASGKIDELVALTDDALTELRRAVRQLGPAIVDEVGLEAAIEHCCEDVAERAGIEVDCTLAAAAACAGLETACYRIVQEALTNVARHAAAKRAAVRLLCTPAGIAIEIEDDGCGFDPALGRRHDAGHGLGGMRERAQVLGGTMFIDSAPGRGTRLRIELPTPGRARAATEAGGGEATEAEQEHG